MTDTPTNLVDPSTKPQGRLILVYGAAGLGKTTLAAAVAEQIIDLEGGCWHIPGANSIPVANAKGLIPALATDATCIAIDTMDAIDDMLRDEVLAKQKIQTMQDLPFGKASLLQYQLWQPIITAIIEAKRAGKTIVMTCHEKILTVQNPIGDNYDKYSLAINKKAAEDLLNKCDAVFYIRNPVILKKDSDGASVALSSTKVQIETQGSALWESKNRFGLTGSVDIKPTFLKELLCK